MKFFEMVSGFLPDEKKIEDFFRDNTQMMEVEKGEIISTNGSYNRNIYFVEKGLMRSFYYENGKDITTNFYAEQKLIANIDTLFKNQPTRYNIEAIENTELLYCDFGKVELLCEQSLPAANFSRYILGILMNQMADRIASLQYMTAREKYEELMRENKDIILRAPLGMIAGYLGISQETLSRIRSGK
ncbi:MAG: Crp/Fnr family transcriptional regulator [Bergeyella sp.]